MAAGLREGSTAGVRFTWLCGASARRYGTLFGDFGPSGEDLHNAEVRIKKRGRPLFGSPLAPQRDLTGTLLRAPDAFLCGCRT